MLKRKGARANGRRIDHAFSARFKTARCPASVVQLRSSRPRDGPLCETAAHPSPLTQSRLTRASQGLYPIAEYESLPIHEAPAAAVPAGADTGSARRLRPASAPPRQEL